MTGHESHNVGTGKGNELPAWDGASYAANTGHHRLTDAAFLDTVTFGPTDRVLDIGCGAGDFTRKVADLIPDGWVTGIDPSASLLDHARSIAGPNQVFQELRAQELARVERDRDFDAILSRATLHWVPKVDHPGVLLAARDLLRPGGILRLEFGGGDNIDEMRLWLNEVAAVHGGSADPWYFPQAGEYLDLVDGAGFDLSEGWVRLIGQRRSFDRAGLIGWLTSQAVQAYEVAMTTEGAAAFRSQVVEEVDRMRRPDGTYDLTFTRMDVSARRR